MSYNLILIIMEKLQLFVCIWGLAGVSLCLAAELVLKRLKRLYGTKEDATEYIRLRNNVLMSFLAAIFLISFILLLALLCTEDSYYLLIPCGIVLLGGCGLAVLGIKKKKS